VLIHWQFLFVVDRLGLEEHPSLDQEEVEERSFAQF
jgi:hypothetical protein